MSYSKVPPPPLPKQHPWDDPARNMTLRDWFAGMIAQGILAGGWADTVPLDDCDHARQLAEFSYDAADALMAKRAGDGMS